MIRRDTFPKVLLMLAGLVFFSANTVYFLDDSGSEVLASVDNTGYYFEFDSIPERTPYLNVKAAMLVNYDNGQVLYAKNVDDVRPIASITKLVTAMVVLDKKLDMKSTQTITKEDSRQSSKSRLRTGYEMTLEDLLYAALMQSDNRAARALARAVSGTYEEFASEMFLVSPYKVLAGKTGYIFESDYCLTTMLQNKEGERLTLVVLGTPGDRLRFREARKLADWGFKKI